jgi:DNA (cytosine-5)-methyltransferase 1
MVIPVAGNTFERTPGNRARIATLVPQDTVHGTLDKALVIPMATEKGAGRDAGLVTLQRHASVEDVETTPVGTVRGGGFHHGVIVRNNNHRGDPGSMVTSDLEAARSLTTHCHQSLVIPYNRTGVPAKAEYEPAGTISTRDRVAVLVPPTLTDEPELAPVEWTDGDIDDCRFRMFDLPEIARVMQMHEHYDGGEYEVKGNKRERMAQYGNAVTPPAMQMLVGRLAEALG